MHNSVLYINWLAKRDLTGLSTPDAEGYFWRASQRCVLPFVRAYWLLWERDSSGKFRKRPNDSDNRPSWRPETWRPLGEGWMRYLRADQVLDLIAFYHEPNDNESRFYGAVRRAMTGGRLKSGWLLPVDKPLLAWPGLLNRRVESLRIDETNDEPDTAENVNSARLRWSRKAEWFPLVTRFAATEGDTRGLDPVHTPESERAGLSGYLCDGWHISDDGNLEPENPASAWGPSTGIIPGCFANAPRRLMLGAALQAKAVPLITMESPAGSEKDSAHKPPGCNLRVAFSIGQGYTHEDAFVISESATRKFSSPVVEDYIRLLIPSVVSRIDCAKPGPVACDGYLVRAHIDLFGLGWSRHELKQLHGKDGLPLCSEDGWLEIAIPGSKVSRDIEVLDVERGWLDHTFWREQITFRVRRGENARPLKVGDKLATRHGIKGVVGRVVPDVEMPMDAEILLSPEGVLRRQAMGQFREAVDFTVRSELPQSGTIFVLRQPQDAEDAVGVCGKGRSDSRGQRYGWMEFAALLAHGATAVAQELLSVSRATAGWMRWESECRDLDERLAAWASHNDSLDQVDHHQLARQALNRYLSAMAIVIDERRLKLPTVSDRTISVWKPRYGLKVRLYQSKDAKNVQENLSIPEWWKEQRGSVFLDFGETPITVPLNDIWKTFRKKIDQEEPAEGRVSADSDSDLESEDVDQRINVQFHVFPLLPPWLRPESERGPHPLTRFYRKLLASCQNKDRWNGGSDLIREGLRLTFDKSCGAEAFVRREVLGRRLNRSARAVIVPDPALSIDEIRLPKFIADSIFEGLIPLQQRRVLVHRNPLLHRRGLLALKPVIAESNVPVFGLPLGILSVMGADFDGDQVCIVALETEQAMAAAELMSPGSQNDLRKDPFRLGSCPAFPLLHELRVPDEERQLASLTLSDLSQRDWCKRFKRMLRTRIDALTKASDGWAEEQRTMEAVHKLDVKDTEKGNTAHRRELYQGKFDVENQQEWFDWARLELLKVYGTVRAKGRLGGVLRQQLYRLRHNPDDIERFRKGVEACQVVTERLTQSALDVKTGKGVSRFNPVKFFENRPKDHEQALLTLDEQFDINAICTALGELEDPTGLLLWLQNPSLKTLAKMIGERDLHNSSADDDPRVNWYL